MWQIRKQREKYERGTGACKEWFERGFNSGRARFGWDLVWTCDARRCKSVKVSMLGKNRREVKNEKNTRRLDVAMCRDGCVDGDVGVRVKCNRQDRIGRLETIKETRDKIARHLSWTRVHAVVVGSLTQYFFYRLCTYLSMCVCVCV